MNVKQEQPSRLLRDTIARESLLEASCSCSASPFEQPLTSFSLGPKLHDGHCVWGYC